MHSKQHKSLVEKNALHKPWGKNRIQILQKYFIGKENYRVLLMEL